MSATIRTNYTAPGVQNPSPWQQALAATNALLAGGGALSPNGATQYGAPPAGGWSNMAVDTGGLAAPAAFSTLVAGGQPAKQDSGSYQANPFGLSVDYSSPSQTGAPASTSPYGYSYSSPGAGFNPWGLYDGRTGYDGTASDGVGLYNAAKDSAKGWGPNGTPETDRDRVWRMTLDDLKAQGLDPGSADPAKVQAAFLNNIARLHRDYNNTAGLGAQAWANSAFAGYDKLNQGGAPGTSQYTPNTLGGSVDYASGGASGQGGSSAMAAPLGGGQPTTAGGGGAATPPTQPTGGTYPNTSHTTGSFGQLGNFDPTYAAQAAGQDPGIAAHYLRLAAGQTGPVTTRLGQFRDSLYGKALQAVLALNGVGGGTGSAGDDMQGFLAALQSGNIGAYLNSAASRAGGADFTGQQDTDVEKILRAALALRSVNTGSLGASLGSNDLDNLLYQQEGAGLGSNGTDMTGLGSRLRSDQYGQALQQFLGASR